MLVRRYSGREGVERLSARRRRARRVLLSLAVLLALVLAGLFLWWVWQPSTRISKVTVYGAPQSFAMYATRAMQGAYGGVVPRNSVFFYPAHQIRVAILAEHPEIAAVSLFREGLSGLSIKLIERVAIARWCAGAPSSQQCYYFDASGYIYAAVDAATTTPLNSFALYEPLAASSSEPLGATLARAAELPGAFSFARQVAALGTPVESVVIRSDAGEVDDLLASGTRITYVLGEEHDAFAALYAVRLSLNLADGSLSYVDLRFPGKVYVKKYGQ